jgi:predicted DNA-binding transcriptional regulator AlpA
MRGVRMARVLEDPDGRLVEVLTATEAGVVLGVSRQRVYQLAAEREDFPPPLHQDADTGGRVTLWSRLEIEEWNLKTRGAGRPPKDPARPIGYGVDVKVSFEPRFAPTDAGMAAFTAAMSRLASRRLVEPAVLWLGNIAFVYLRSVALNPEQAAETASKIIKLRAALEARIAPEWAITTEVQGVEILPEEAT